LGSIGQVAIFFLLSISFGSTLFSILANSKNTGAGLIRVLSTISATSMIVALITFLTSGESFYQALTLLIIGTIILQIITYFFHRDGKSILMWTIYTLSGVTHTLCAYFLVDQKLVPFLFYFSSMLYLGVVHYVMILGHWYLVTPKLSNKPLLKGLLIFWPLLLLKLTATSFGAFDKMDFFTEGTILGSGYSFNWIMLIMRVVWGYLILLVLSYFGWKLVKMRDIQSATGIFYVMVFFVYIAEIISTYLYFEHGLLL
jgi:hypothetical protein